jgi:AraC family transcriptional regulator, regulatory protein of adaptative response / DNA-3-methyladenine glycosylase II
VPSLQSDRRGDLVGRAMRLIADGLIDREGVSGLSRRLGHPASEIDRRLESAAGGDASALRDAQRTHLAQMLLEQTALPIAQVAVAAGFRGTRQLATATRRGLALSPSELRRQAGRGGASRAGPVPGPLPPSGPGAVTLRLPYRAPFDAQGLIAYLKLRVVPGVEEVVGDVYRRSLRLPRGAGVVELQAADSHVRARFRLDDLRDLAPALQRSRELLDLDADPRPVARTLGADPLIGALVRASPGRRVAGHVDGHELAVRAVLGQQVSLAAAATHAARLVSAHGEPLARPVGGVTHLFPSPAALAEIDPATLGMPRARARALIGLAAAMASGELILDPGVERGEAVDRLLALPGIGPWTASYVAMRTLRDPDAFMPSDLGVRHALEWLGQPGDPAAATRLAERWRPYRAYALQHLWALIAE